MSLALDRIRLHLTRWAVPVLTLWALTLVLNVLAPCCEAIAAAVPHQHVGGNEHAGHASLGYDHAAPVDGHSHCPALDKVDRGLVDSLVHQGEYHSTVLPAPEVARIGIRGSRMFLHGRFAAAVQQTGPPVYLATQRFRI